MNNAGSISYLSKREDLIRQYHNEGYTHEEIVNFLLYCHDISISVRQLKRTLHSLGLKRKNYLESPLKDVCTAIIAELAGSGSCLGYKTMWQRLQKTYGLSVKRNLVLQILRIADPEGITNRCKQRLRRRKYIVPGPNFLWHTDGYDKLKPFGFAIHGCIDGFSRKILWLEVATSNNKPEIIAYYYLKTLKKFKLVPTLLRSDKGTENVLIECLQKSLRHDHNDKLSGSKSYIKGKSTSNQRIESYWSQMRRLGGDFWISYFKDLRDNCIFNDSDQIHIECLRYCFGPLIQYDLEQVRTEWNQHRIRKQRNCELPSGKPNCLFHTPEMYNATDYRKVVDDGAIDICLDKYSIEPKLFSSTFGELVEMCKPDCVSPTNVDDALKLYIQLLDIIETIMPVHTDCTWTLQDSTGSRQDKRPQQ